MKPTLAPGRGTLTPAPRVVQKRWPGSSVRWGLALTSAGTAFAVSYAAQRLLSWVHGEPDFGQVVMSGSTPLYWRCGLALLHAAIVAALVRIGVDEDRAEVALRYAPIWVPLAVLPLALALVGIP